MKLIVAGATGFVGTEVVRQALSHPKITSILALARRPTPVPSNAGPGADPSKLQSVVCDNFENYSDTVKKQLAGADACVWYVFVFSLHLTSNLFSPISLQIIVSCNIDVPRLLMTIQAHCRHSFAVEKHAMGTGEEDLLRLYCQGPRDHWPAGALVRPAAAFPVHKRCQLGAGS